MGPELNIKSSGGGKGFKMNEGRQQVRNSNGSLICDLLYADGSWNVTIKRKECLTIINLMPDGSVYIEDAPPGERLGKQVAVYYS